MSYRIFLTFVVGTIVGFLGANMFQLEKSADEDEDADDKKTRIKADEFLSQLDKEKLIEIKNSMDGLRRIYTKELFIPFKLEKFVTAENPANVNVLRSSGEIDTNWTIEDGGFIYPSMGSTWFFIAKSPGEKEKNQNLEWLINSLDPSEHFKIHALIKFLNTNY
jgi:hypothetical protein